MKYLLDLMYMRIPLKLLPMLVSLRIDRMRKRIHSRPSMEQQDSEEQKQKQRTTNTLQRSMGELPLGIPDWLKKL